MESKNGTAPVQRSPTILLTPYQRTLQPAIIYRSYNSGVARPLVSPAVDNAARLTASNHVQRANLLMGSQNIAQTISALLQETRSFRVP